MQGKEKVIKKIIISIVCIFCLIWPVKVSYAAETNPTEMEPIEYFSDVIPGNGARAVNAQGTWHQDSTGWRFEYSGGGYPTSVWEYINIHWYYFNSDGYMLIGWQLINSYWYYLDLRMICCGRWSNK